MNLIFILSIVILYLLPSIVEIKRGTKYTSGIFLLNLLLGWTILGWIASLIWAVSAPIETDKSKRGWRPWEKA